VPWLGWRCKLVDSVAQHAVKQCARWDELLGSGGDAATACSYRGEGEREQRERASERGETG
jgi:hypothetical protein